MSFLFAGMNSLGITILISSHILSELEQTATRIGILHDGAIVKELATQDAFQNDETLEDMYLHYTGASVKSLNIRHLTNVPMGGQ